MGVVKRTTELLEDLLTGPFFFGLAKNYRNATQATIILDPTVPSEVHHDPDYPSRALKIGALSIAVADYALGTRLLEQFGARPDFIPQIFGPMLSDVVTMAGYGLGLVANTGLREYTREAEKTLLT